VEVGEKQDFGEANYKKRARPSTHKKPSRDNLGGFFVEVGEKQDFGEANAFTIYYLPFCYPVKKA